MTYSFKRSLEELRKEGRVVEYITMREGKRAKVVELVSIGKTYNEAYESIMSKCERLERDLKDNPKFEGCRLGICSATSEE